MKMDFALTRRFQITLLAFLLLFLTSIIGYVILEGYTLSDAAYMTAITLTTVGFGEVRPLSPQGQVFTIIIILLGVAILAVFFSTMTEYIVAGELAGILKVRRMHLTIDKLRDHFIVCGFGRIGERVTQGLKNEGIPLVVLDINETAIQRCQELGIACLLADATEDDSLQTVGIERAKGLLAVMDDDASNVFVVLSARSLNPDLTILARASCEDSETKFRTAGADLVVSPNAMASSNIVNQLVRPHVSSFIASTTHRGFELSIEEIRVTSQSTLVGQSLAESELRSRTGANVLAIARCPHDKILDWAPTLQIENEDVLIVLVRPNEFEAIGQLAEDPRFV